MVAGNLAYSIQSNSSKKELPKEYPLKWCSVSLSDVISRGKRLEASVFDVEAKQAFNVIKQCKYNTIPLYGEDGIVCNAHYGGRLKRNYVTPEHENAIGFIGSSEMLDIYPKPVKFMIDEDRVRDLHIKENTVLLSRSGTIGNVSFCNKTLSRFLVSEHAIRLECKKSAGYVYAFLKTNIGKKLVCSNIYGAVIQQIEPEHLETVPIPNAPDEIKEKIHNLIVESYKLRDESNDLIDEATNLMIEELKLPPIKDFDVDYYKKDASVNTFSVKLSHMNGRADASYHVPIVDAIIEHLNKYAAEVTTVGDERISKDIILPGRFKRIYVEKGYGVTFFSGKNISELDPSDKRYLSFSQHDKKIKNELIIREGMILVTCSGTIGNSILVPKHWDNWAMTHDIIRIIPCPQVRGYVYVWLNSDYGRIILQSLQYGSVVQHIEKEHIAQMVVPLLQNIDKQNQINNLVLEANNKRYEAYLLEQEALRTMDEEVIYAR